MHDYSLDTESDFGYIWFMASEPKSLLFELTELVADLAEETAALIDHSTHMLQPGEPVRAARAKAGHIREKQHAIRELLWQARPN